MPVADRGEGQPEPPVLQLTVAEAVQRARALSTGPGRYLLGVTGAPGAGKSTLCDALLHHLGSAACAAPMDGFHLANEVLQDLGRRDRKGAVDTFDVLGYAALLRRVREREEQVVYAPRFDRVLETAIAAALPIPREVPLVIAEGNYLLHDHDGWEQVGELLDEVWFVDVPAQERVRRLVQRRVSHGHAVADARSWVQQVDERNAAVVTKTRNRADLILHLTDGYQSDGDQTSKETS